MTTKIGEYLTRFYGGKERGVCFQITTYEPCKTDFVSYVTLTKAEFEKMMRDYRRFKKAEAAKA